MKLLSVLIPAYNCESSLARCLDSLVYQAALNYEIVIVNDGSTDKTFEIAEHYEQAFPGLIRVISRENGGVGQARNTALDHAEGKYIYFVDADDTVEIDAIEVMMHEFEDENVDIVCAGHDLVSDRFNIKNHVLSKQAINSEEAMRLLLKDWQLRNYCWGKCFKKSLFDGMRFEGKCFEDVLLVHQIMMRAKKIVLLPNILYHYTVDQKASLTSNMSAKKLEEWMDACVEQAMNIVKVYPSLAKPAANMIRKNALISIGRIMLDSNSLKEEKEGSLKKIKEQLRFAKSLKNLRGKLNAID